MIALPGIAIQSQIYESSASLVYRGTRIEDNRAIVVKLLKQDYPSPQELTRYRQEYEITRSLNLAGVVKAYSQQDYQRTLAILLEDFGGESVERWMQQRPNAFCPMPLSTFLPLAIDITEILGRVHNANVIHKDISPGNIVFNPDTGVVKIIDFGIATRFNRTNPTFKSPHMLEGTLAYISPEQTGRMNRFLDYRTDFYSLGVTFYELLTGQLPFPTTDILELVHCHIAKSPIPPHEVKGVGCGVRGVGMDSSSSTKDTIPKAVSDIVMKLMAKNAEDRYQSAWGIKADLERCAQQLEEMGQINSIPLGLQDISEQFHIPQKLYGREAEIAALLAAFESVVATDFVADEADGESVHHAIQSSASSVSHPLPMMMLVSGYAGVGKSALVQELYRPITARHGYFISGKFDQFGRNIPYSAIINALKKLIQQLLGEPDEQVQQWRSRLLTALGSNGQIIINVIPEVELIIGKQPPLPEVGATEAQNRFNLTFQRFMRTFCAKEHPLVILLDDLQWIDSATLKLIELILLGEQTQHLFLIGAYRDNEVSPTHPLVLTLESLRNQGAVLQEIILTPLTLEPLSQLVAETLYHNLDTVRSLAQVVLCKTEGNPFFVGEFLKMLYGENLLIFNAQQLSWQWDIDQIQAQTITDNVVELLLSRLKKLPEETQQILQIAACIGSEFDLDTLALSAERNSEGTVCEKSPQSIFQNLLAAIQAELIQPLSELDENLLVQAYKFLHDRVQQAAYTLIDQSQKQAVHLQIGHNLLKKTSPEHLSDRLFEIVDHLDYGIELVTDQLERNEIARLNLMAGQKAKGAIAYSVAKKYLATGREWLAASSWQTNYDLTLEIHSETVEVAYLCGDFEQVESWISTTVQEAKTVLDIVKVYEVKIQTHMAQGELLKAINIGLQVLRQLGIDFPENPSQTDIQFELSKITSLLSEKPIEDLLHLPDMTELDKLAAVRILSGIELAVAYTDPNLFPLFAAKRVSLSIQYGNSSLSASAYASYGLVLCGIAGNIEVGYQFEQLALKLLSQSNTKASKARVLTSISCIFPWKEHIRKALKLLLEGYQSGLETGDLEFAAICACMYCAYVYFTGKELVEIERDTATYSEAVRRLKQELELVRIRIYHQTIANLMGCSTNPCYLVGEFYNEKNELPKHEAANDAITIFAVYFNKLCLCYLFSEYAQAVENSTIAERYVSYLAATCIVPYYFYNSLAELAIYATSSVQAQEETLKKVAVRQEKMEYWARYAPMNYLHKFCLVEAEKARVLGKFLEAEEFYERAISGASENGFIQEEALAYELAAKHYLARGRGKIAQTYMKEAHYCYDRWGAKAKVKDLETRYPQFFSQSPRVAATSIFTTSGTSNTSHATFDLAAVMKASQAISREVELEPLLRSLMQILIENAGAQTGYLILENSGEWLIEAACELNDENVCNTQVLQSIPIANQLPESIIQYVIRTQEPVTLDNATREGTFIHEPYIQQNQTKSIFCLPLLNQAKLVGVLYLENQLATGAFTPERFSEGDATRSQVLNLLSTQAAIAIEHAKLYSQLRAKESQMAQFLEAIPVGIGIVDAAGRPYYANQRATQLVGKESDPSVPLEQLVEVYQFYLTGTDQAYPTEKMATFRALRGERTRNDDLEIHQNNTTIPVETWGTPVYDEQGNVIYAIVAFQDITERKQAERLLADYNRTLEQQVAQRTAALQESEAKFASAFRASPVAIAISTLDEGQYVDVNEAFSRIGGYAREEVIGRTSEELGIFKTPAQRTSLIQMLQATGSIRNLEQEAYTRSGEVITVLCSAELINLNGRACALWVAEDITQRKRVKEALQRSEAKFRTIFENSQVGIFRTRLSDGLILDANQRLAEMFGFDSPNELIGKHSANFHVHPDDRKQIVKLLRHHGELQNFEFQMRKRDGTLFWVLYSSRLNATDGYIIGVFADISDRRRAEEASILEERNRMAREIHDTLAQAFTGILIQVGGATQVLTDDSEATQSHLDTIEALARTGLSEARRSVAALRPQLLESGDLSSALDRLVIQMRATTDTALMYEIQGIAYSLPSEVENNLLRIGQEALTNAIKHACANEIRIELLYDDAQCRLRVKDDGQGFGVVGVPTLGRFGLLGMSERAEHIGAQLTIESQPGQGTEIVVIVGV